MMIPWGLEVTICVGKRLERWVIWLGADHEGNIGLVKGSGCAAVPAWIQISPFPSYEILDKELPL